MEIKNGLHPSGNGIQKIYRFDNNYGASIVRFKLSHGVFGSYTDNENEWELAVIKFTSGNNDCWGICYDTPITDDVMGHLSDSDVKNILDEIKELPKECE